MTKRKRNLIIALIALYIIAPDLLPGHVDDLLVLLLTTPVLMDTPTKEKE